MNFAWRSEQADPRSLGGLRRDQSPTHETKARWDGHKEEKGEETGGFAPVSAGLVLPCLVKITNMGRADLLPHVAPISRISELLQSFEPESQAGSTGERLPSRLQAPALDAGARAEMFPSRGSSFAPEKQTNELVHVRFFCLFSCRLEELEDKL